MAEVINLFHTLTDLFEHICTEVVTLNPAYYLVSVIIFAGFYLLGRKAFRFDRPLSVVNGLTAAYTYFVFAGTVLIRGGFTVFMPGTPGGAVAMEPFESLKLALGGNSYYWRMIGINTLLILPFGFLSPFIYSEFMKASARPRLYTFLLTALTSFLFTLTIELAQYITSTGVFELDDLIFNFLGAMIGFLVYLVFRKIFKNT